MKSTALFLVFAPILLVSAALRGDVAMQPVDPVAVSVEPDDPVAADLVASPDVDEISLSNAVAIAAAAARATEEVRVAAAAEERAELMKEKAAAEAKTEIALARRRISTRTFRLAHASAEDVAAKLNSTWSGDFGVVWKINKMAIAFPESNAVMITAPSMILEACEQVIREIDVEPKQVYIEARFVELSNNVFHDIGIDWSMLDGMKGTVSLGGGIQKNRLGKGVQDYTRTTKDGTASYTLSGSALNGGADGDIAYFNGTLDFSQMYVVLSALEGSQDARIFSNPKIIVSSGRKATVDMTTKYPNVKIAAKRTTTSGSDSLDLDMQMASSAGVYRLTLRRGSAPTDLSTSRLSRRFRRRTAGSSLARSPMPTAARFPRASPLSRFSASSPSSPWRVARRR